MSTIKRPSVKCTEEGLKFFRTCLKINGDNFHQVMNLLMIRYCLDVTENYNLDNPEILSQLIIDKFS